MGFALRHPAAQHIARHSGTWCTLQTLPTAQSPVRHCLCAGLPQVLLLLLRRQLLLLEVPLRTRLQLRQVATPMPLQPPTWQRAVPWSRASKGWVPDRSTMHFQAAMLMLPFKVAAPVHPCRAEARQQRSTAVPA